MSLEKHSSEINESGESSSGCVPEYDSRFFGDGTPNTPPQECVDSKKAVNINIIEDEDIIEEADQFWTPNDPTEVVEVIEVVFNDGSDWKWPLRSWDKDCQRARFQFVEDYAPDVIRHRAELNGEDPEEAFKNSIFHDSDEKLEWVKDLENVKLDEKTREWFNRNADYLPELHRRVESSRDNLNLDVSNDSSWEDDW
jgi:hypothetical protein